MHRVEILNALLQQSHEGVVLADEEGRVAVWNPALEQLTGISSGEAVGRPLPEVIGAVMPPEAAHAQALSYMKGEIQTCVDTGQSRSLNRLLEFEIVRKDGSRRWSQQTFFSVATEKGRVLAGFLRDITESRDAQRTVRDREERFRTVAELSPALITLVRGERFEYVNPAVEALTGFTREELMAMPPSSLVAEADRGQIGQPRGELVRSGAAAPSFQFRMLTKSGESRWVEMRSTAIEVTGEDGVLSISVDITERRLMEAQLRESEAQFRNVAEMSPALVTVLQGGHYVYTNAAAEALTGYSQEELAAIPVERLIHEQDRGTMLQRLGARVAGATIGPAVEFRLLTKSRAIRWLEIRSSRIEYRGRPAALSVGTDITERKRAERQILQRMKELGALYTLSELDEREGITLDELYQELADILPSGWQHTEIGCARIVIGGRDYRTANFGESAWQQSAPIKVDGIEVGRIEVGYLEERPEEEEGPFSKEERRLIDVIAERVGHMTERRLLGGRLRESESKFRAVAELSPSIVTLTQGNKFIYANVAMERVIGYTSEELLGLPVERILCDEERDSRMGRVLTRERGEEIGPKSTYQVVSKSGEKRWVELSTALMDQDGVPTVLSTGSDVTDRVEMERRIEQQNAYLGALHETSLALGQRLELAGVLEIILARAAGLVGAAHGFVSLTSADGDAEEIKYAIGDFSGWCGFRSARGQGFAGRVLELGQPIVIADWENWAGRIKSQDKLMIKSMVGVPLLSGGAVRGVLGLGYSEEGRLFSQRDVELLTGFAQLAALALDNASLYERAQQEISERRQAEEALRYVSFHDALTGLYNRAYFEEEMRRLEGSRAYPVTLISLDVDGLKLVNDSLGHKAGDDMLVRVARLVQQAFRTSDVVARIGGDEFAVILGETPEVVATRLCSRLSEVLDNGNASGREVPLGVSIGIATATADKTTLAETYQVADQRMYQHKSSPARRETRSALSNVLRSINDQDGTTTPGGLSFYK